MGERELRVHLCMRTHLCTINGPRLWKIAAEFDCHGRSGLEDNFKSLVSNL